MKVWAVRNKNCVKICDRNPLRWFWWKKPRHGYRKKKFSTFKFVIISFCTWKPNTMGLGNCNVCSIFAKPVLDICAVCSLVPGINLSHTQQLFIPQKLKIVSREGWFRVFPILRVEDHNTIFSTFCVRDDFSNCYSQNLRKKIQILSIKLFSKKNQT